MQIIHVSSAHGVRDYLSICGNMKLTVKGNSMTGTLADGDIVTVAAVPVPELKTGDIIAFEFPKDNICVHRLIKKYLKEEGIFLKVRGDSNYFRDPYIPVKRALGKVISVEREGNKIEFDQRWKRILFGKLDRIGILWFIFYQIKSKHFNILQFIHIIKRRFSHGSY